MMDWWPLILFVAGGLIGGIIGIVCTIWAINYTFGRMYPVRREAVSYDHIARPDESADGSPVHSGLPLTRE